MSLYDETFNFTCSSCGITGSEAHHGYNEIEEEEFCDNCWPDALEEFRADYADIPSANRADELVKSLTMVLSDLTTGVQGVDVGIEYALKIARDLRYDLARAGYEVSEPKPLKKAVAP